VLGYRLLRVSVRFSLGVVWVQLHVLGYRLLRVCVRFSLGVVWV
jgi:hypothetical protein